MRSIYSRSRFDSSFASNMAGEASRFPDVDFDLESGTGISDVVCNLVSTDSLDYIFDYISIIFILFTVCIMDPTLWKLIAVNSRVINV